MEELDTAELKNWIVALEEAFNKNQQMRVKYADDPKEYGFILS